MQEMATSATGTADAAALLRWARTSGSSALAVVRADGYSLRYPLFDELNEGSRGGLRWLSGPHHQHQYAGLEELALREAQELLRSDRPRLCARFERVDGEGAIELRLERLSRSQGDLAVVVAHATASRSRTAHPAAPLRGEDLLREERMQAMGVVAAGVAHDLNHALNVIALRLARLRQDPALAGARTHLESLEKVADEAAATVARLTDLVRRRRNPPTASLDLSRVVEAAVEAARSELEEGVPRRIGGEPEPPRVRIECELPHLPLVRGSATEVSHIFLDLLLNACDAMPRGGLVRVRGKVQGEEVVVTVEDEGPGVPEHHLLRVFDPFFTLSATRDTGLGLSIAAGVMARLVGSIGVGNRPSGGSVYTLTFPLAGAEVQKPPALAEPPHPAKPLRVLLVDDEADNLEVLSEVLEAEGHEVECAANGRAALEALRSHRGFDLVLSDVGMPGMSGWQLVREAKAIEPSLCIFMLTGWANEIAGDDPRTSLVRGVLGKPIDLDQLRRLIAHVSEEKAAAPT
jgi:signal transduction histidine kinase/ActR/RegA family two-component response regulator